MRILAVSDVELSHLYSPQVAERYRLTDVILSCGDLPYYYLEYMMTMLNAPLFYVHGNHQNQLEYHLTGVRTSPLGGVDLHQKVVRYGGKILAGLQGCLQYNFGPMQYSQTDYWGLVFSLVPTLFWMKIQHGRYLDILVTHAPPWKIQDMEDRPHQGIKAFRWLLRVFQPEYHLHGHIHLYRNSATRLTQFHQTRVLNTFGCQELTI